MIAAAQHITTVIGSNATISAELTHGLHWDFNTIEKGATPFAFFSLEETPGVSKDLEGSYRVTLFVFADKMRRAAEIADIIKEQVKLTQGRNWKYESGRGGYTSAEAKEANAEIVFTFKI